MLLIINGENKYLAPVASVSELVAHLALAKDRVAVEINGRIIKKPEWEATPLAEGDRIEIIQFVGGG
jgi:sulfur carrier protein